MFWYIYILSYICPEDIGEIQHGQLISRNEVPHLSSIGALMYLANSTRPDIAFAVNLLARHSAAPTKHHWVGIKSIIRYINDTRDLWLFYNRNKDPVLLGYTDDVYLLEPHNGKSQTCFVFLQGGTTISWKSSKQTLMSTSTNHSKIIALYEASRECVASQNDKPHNTIMWYKYTWRVHGR